MCTISSKSQIFSFFFTCSNSMKTISFSIHFIFFFILLFCFVLFWTGGLLKGKLNHGFGVEHWERPMIGSEATGGVLLRGTTYDDEPDGYILLLITSARYNIWVKLNPNPNPIPGSVSNRKWSQRTTKRVRTVQNIRSSVLFSLWL